jgi:uncharacterized protein YjdB
MGVALAALGLALSACDNGPDLAQTLVLSVPSTSLLVGQTTQITPTVTGKSGKTLTGRVITYQSSAPQIAVVSSTGVILAAAPGSAVISGLVDGVTGSVSIVVSPVPVSRVALSRDTATLAATTTLQLTATPLDSAGHALADRTVTWSSSDTTVAKVSASGLVTAIAVGTANIVATSEGKTGQTRITVTPAAVASIDVTPGSPTVSEGFTVQLTAVARDALGRVLTGRALAWSSSNIAAATVDANGLVRGVAPGIANIIVTSGNVFGGASVRVIAVNVGSVTVTPDSSTVNVGQTTQLTAVVKDSAGRVITKPVAWTSLNTGVATVDANGLVTGVSFGTASIVAQSQTKADTVTVTVTTTISSIIVGPARVDLGLGRTGKLVVTIRDAQGNVVTGFPVSFVSSDTTVAPVDSLGVLSGRSIGSALVYALAGGRFGSSSVNVVAAGVNSIPTTFAAVTLAPDDTSQIVFTLRDLGGTVLSNRIVVFTSSDPTVATVGPTGLITAVGTGTATLTISSEGVSVNIAVTVT